MAQSQEADSLTTDYGDTIANSTMPEGLTLEMAPFPKADHYHIKLGGALRTLLQTSVTSARKQRPALTYNGNEYAFSYKIKAASVALPCPMGLRPGACGCRSAA
ncbi:MAG: hypothetical protein RI591_03405 [Dehalococcoidia bacterium]|nr:hypothetical protein [Dehalococcoidia bacterium]